MRAFILGLLRRLIRLLPAEFRYDFGESIEADIAERERCDRAGLLRRDLPTLMIAIVREHADALRQDLRYALRTIRRTPGFTAMAVLMLALGTGVNAAVFSIVDAVLFRSPYRDPDRIVGVMEMAGRTTPTWQVPIEKYNALVAGGGPFAAVAGFNGGGTHFTTAGGDLRRLEAECVSASMFDVLGTPPLLGRRFDVGDDRPGAAPVMVVSYGFWGRLGSSPAIVGSTVVVNQMPVSIIGVMPRFFAGPFSRSDTEAWLPMHRPIAGGDAPGCPPVSTSMNMNTFARLAPGVPLEQAGTRIGTLVLRRLDDHTFLEIRQQFTILGGAVLCVLLIACFNVGGLQMERTLARRREMAVRLALGASRARLVRQVMTENLVLALFGAAAGLVATALTLGFIVSLLPGSMPYLEEIEINARVFGAALVAATSAAVVAGVLPLRQTWRLDPATDLAPGVRATARQGDWTRRVLVVIEVALSVVLLISAGLMVRTFLLLRPVEPGFDGSRKASIRIRVDADTPDMRRQLASDLAALLGRSDGVRRVTVSTYLPMSGNVPIVPVRFGATTANILAPAVTPEFFEVMRIPLLVGRTFSTTDSASSVPVAIVDEVMARRIRPDGQVLGERVSVTFDKTLVERQIVGVVGPIRYIGGDTRPRPIVWMPYAQHPSPFLHAIAEADGRPAARLVPALREAMRTLRPNVAPGDPMTLDTMLDRSVATWRFGAWLVGTFAGIAVLLAALGLMTTMGWWVRQRTRELGVRLALGATRGGIVRLVGTQGLVLAATGVALGAAAAAGVTRYLASWLYGVTPLDAPTFAFGAMAMLVVASIAILVPVQRATRVDPVVALRTE